MSAEAAVSLAREAIILALMISAPIVIVALVVGIILSVLQAATQVQDQSIGTVPKLVAIYLTIIVIGLWAVGALIRFGRTLFEMIANVG